MTAGRAYLSPAAFRQALTDRLRQKAKDGPWSLTELQRQIAYDRLLERLYSVDREWVVKGATALLARNLAVRATIDIDLFRDAELDTVEREVREAAARDLNDWFRFEIGRGQPTSQAGVGVRVPVVAYIGATIWCSFKVDLTGSKLSMSGEPDDVPPIAHLSMPDLEQHGYRAYPLVDHIADKVAAIFQRYGTSEAPSTRYKDLVDLVAIVSRASVEAAVQETALKSEAQRRGVRLPHRFNIPDRTLWEKGYAAESDRSLLAEALTLDEAVDLVAAFVDPLLDGSASGKWNPNDRRWGERTPREGD